MRRVVLVLVLLAVAGRREAAAAEAGRITVGTAATVASARVRLADVAALEGSARGFADVDLGPAPEANSSRRIDGLNILRRLQAAGMDSGTTRYDIPQTVRIERATQEVSADEIRTAIAEAASATLGPGESIRSLDITGGVRIPLGTYETRVSAAARGQGVRRRFDVRLLQEGDVVAIVPVRAEIETYGAVVTMRQAVARGTVLGADDVALEERDLTGMQTSAVRDLHQAIGKEVRMPLPAGGILSVGALASPQLIRRGDLVTLIIETPGMRLSVAGEALEGAARGGTVRVLNRTSRQELSGKAVDRGVVLVQF